MSNRLLMVQIDGLDSGGATVSKYYANEGFVLSTGPENVEGRLLQAGRLRKSMYGAERITGDTPIESGAIVLNNADGALDSLLTTYSFDGQRAYISEMNRTTGATTAQMRVVYNEQPALDDETLAFAVRDAAHANDVILLRAAKYGGTNALPAGIDGVAGDIKDQYKPLCIGTVKNVSPVCVNTSKLIYQVDGQRGLVTGWAMTVYDKRAALTPGADYVSQADMEATAPAAGGFRVWPAGGCFRLNATPTVVTCDILNPTLLGTTSGIKDVIQALSGYGGSIVSFQLFTNNPVAGIYVQDDRTAHQAINDLLRGINGFYTYGGRPTLGGGVSGSWASHLADPASLPFTPVMDAVPIDDSMIIRGSFRRVCPPESARGLPVWRVNVQYQKNYTVMSTADLAGVALADQNFCAQEYRTTSASDAAVKTQWPAAPELTFVSLLNDATEAATEATRLLNVFKVRRDMFTFRVSAEAVRNNITGAATYLFGLYARVTLTYPRFGLDSGKLMVVVGFIEDYEADQYELTVWG